MADQSIEQSGFASLKLTDASDIETAFGNPRFQLTCFLGDRFGTKFLSQLPSPNRREAPSIDADVSAGRPLVICTSELNRISAYVLPL